MSHPVDDSDKLQRDALVKEAARRRFAASLPDSELEASVGDKKIKIRGSDILTLVIGMVMAAGLATVLYMMIDHRAEAKDGAKGVADALKEANKEVALALRESNATTAAVMKEMIVEQRRMVEATREQNCILAIEQNKRPQMADFCKRIAK